jgi:hypothetical protein
MKRSYSILVLLLILSAASLAQTTRYRGGILLHHSVGGCFWDRSQYSNLTPPTTLPKEIAAYNAAHGYTGANAVSLSEVYGPNPSSLNDNNWYRWDKIFSGTDQYISLSSLLSAPIVVVKTCYISQQFMGSVDSIRTYKTHIRNIVRVMAKNRSTFFILWTNYPAATDGASDRARWSAQFSVWMKDTLSTGKDSYGLFPNNVYVFDVFRKLADPVTGVCPPKYGSYSEGPGGDHPSNAAVAVVDPAFVKETFDAALAYEKIAGVSAVPPTRGDMPLRPGLDQNYPNPFNPSTVIGYQVSTASHVNIRVFDALGREVGTLVDEDRQPGSYSVSYNAGRLASGLYMYRISAGSYVDTKRMLVVK